MRWLAENHTVRIRVGHYPPYNFNKPVPAGMAIDYVTTAAARASNGILRCFVDCKDIVAIYLYARHVVGNAFLRKRARMCLPAARYGNSVLVILTEEHDG